MDKALRKSVSILIAVLMLGFVIVSAGVRASAALGRVYLDVSNVETGEETYYAYVSTDNTSGTWQTLVIGSSQYYEVSVTIGADVIFASVPLGETPSSDWSNVSHQTESITFDGTNNLCTLTGATSGSYIAQWSVYTEEVPTLSVTGTTGDCTWTYLSTGTLTITGTGEMSNYTQASDSDFRYYSDNIKTVTITSSVTSIGSYAFSEFTALESIEISDSVTNIGTCAFEDCTSLTSISLPYSVTAIGAGAFASSAIATIYGYTGSYPETYALENNIDFISLGSAPTENTTEQPTEASTAEPTEISLLYSGISGECTWELYSDGTFKISGTGAMEDYGSNAYVPWRSYSSNIKTAEITSGVTTIGSYAFCNCDSLESVTIPNSITSIGYRAFNNCTSLKSISIPAGTITIGDYAFSECSNLTSATIGNGVETIGNNAFFNCTSLKSITIPNSVTSIGYDAFLNCTSLENITVSEDNENYVSIDGILFNKDITELICYPAEKADATYEIPESVISIGQCAFTDCEFLKSITIPESVTEIGSYSLGYYYDEDSFTNVKYDDFTIYGYSGSVAETYAEENGFTFVSIGEIPTEATTESTETPTQTTEATTGSESTEATSESTQPQSTIYFIYYIPTEKSVEAGYTFKICIQDADGNLYTYDLEATGDTVGGLPLYCATITDPDYSAVASIQYQVYDSTGITWISQTEFEMSATLNDYSDKAFDASTGKVGEFTVDLNDETTEETTIPQYSSVSGTTGDCTWTYNPATSTLTISGSGNMDAYSLTSLSPWYPYNSDINTIIISGNVTSIGDYAFYNFEKIFSITLPDSVTSIGNSAFLNCTNLKSITVPANVTSIGYDVFYNCSNLIIYGYTGSYAETYASENGITFVSIGEAPTDVTTEPTTEATEPTTKATVPTESTEPTTEATEPTNTHSASIKLSKTKLKAGKTAKATVSGASGASVTYKSSNKKVAKINKTTGKVTAKKKGIATIKAKVTYLDGSKEVLTKKLRVTSNPKLSKKTVTLKKGKTLKLKVKGLVGKAKFKSNKKNIAKVNKKGKITAKKKGKATITVTANGVKLKCTVKIKN